MPWNSTVPMWSIKPFDRIVANRQREDLRGLHRGKLGNRRQRLADFRGVDPAIAGDGGSTAGIGWVSGVARFATRCKLHARPARLHRPP